MLARHLLGTDVSRGKRKLQKKYTPPAFKSYYFYPKPKPGKRALPKLTTRVRRLLATDDTVVKSLTLAWKLLKLCPGMPLRKFVMQDIKVFLR